MPEIWALKEHMQRATSAWQVWRKKIHLILKINAKKRRAMQITVRTTWHSQKYVKKKNKANKTQKTCTFLETRKIVKSYIGTQLYASVA